MVKTAIEISDELVTKQVEDFMSVATDCVCLYAKKNSDYGDSFSKGMDAIGIKYGVGRIFDKCNRIVELIKDDKIQQVKDETIDDTLTDLACYSIMMLAYRKHERAAKLKEVELT